MKLNETRLRKLTPQDEAYFAAATHLLNRTQGDGRFAHDFLHKKVSDKNSCVVAAFTGKEVDFIRWPKSKISIKR